MQQELIQTEQEEIDYMNLPVCGGNLSTPVTDQAAYVNEIHYQVGSLSLIENAD